MAGSSQTDDNNVFDWKTQVLDFGEHERIQGAFGHTGMYQQQRNVRTLGFLKGSCWDGMTETEKGNLKDAMADSFFDFDEETSASSEVVTEAPQK